MEVHGDGWSGVQRDEERGGHQVHGFGRLRLERWQQQNKGEATKRSSRLKRRKEHTASSFNVLHAAAHGHGKPNHFWIEGGDHVDGESRPGLLHVQQPPRGRRGEKTHIQQLKCVKRGRKWKGRRVDSLSWNEEGCSRSQHVERKKHQQSPAAARRQAASGSTAWSSRSSVGGMLRPTQQQECMKKPHEKLGGCKMKRDSRSQQMEEVKPLYAHWRGDNAGREECLGHQLHAATTKREEIPPDC
ncbi:hypothetical protein LR48_Vigan07g147400 [Vigna angularis]|uniref:Uncharacterized protein n=1 Tax=Phaseolus angularis TaxID=3914 RepID=A0A0L9UY22_PHAAN|nr:hypothetical protein LR48_Vigan07g147400 [Vigna angularis]